MSNLQQRRVFVVNDAGHDLSPAAKHGQLVVMSQGMLNKFAITAMKRQFDQFLEGSSPEDFILQSGPAIMLALACAIFAAKHGRLNLLLWHGGPTEGDGRYLTRRVRFRKGGTSEPVEGV